MKTFMSKTHLYYGGYFVFISVSDLYFLKSAKFTFSFVVLFSVSVGQSYHSFCVMDWSPESWLWYLSASFLMYCVIYISAPLQISQYLIVEYSASFHRTSTTHTAMRVPVGEKKNILHSQLHTYIYFYGSFCMFRRVLRAGWIRPWHSLLPTFFFPFLRDCSFFFFPLSMTPAANEPLEGASLWL